MKKPKLFIKMLIPPLIWEGLKWVFKSKRKIKKFTFEGKFNSFRDVLDIYQQASNYHTEESSRAAILMAFETLNKYIDHKNADFGWETFRLNILPTVIAGMSIFHKYENIRICDVGGGFGSQYINLLLSLKNNIIQYTIIELPSVAKAGGVIYKNHEEIKFVSQFPEPTESFDIVNFGSSLQYFEQYKEVIETVCAYGASEIILTDLPMSDLSSFVCAQINMENRVMPINVFNCNEIKLIFDKFGYELKLFTKSYYPFHDLSNYVIIAPNMGFYNLIFSKRTSAISAI